MKFKDAQRIFGNARFMAEPAGDGSNGIGDNQGAGGSSDGGSDPGVSVEELRLQLAKAQADLERQKHANDKLSKNNKELTDQVRKNMSDEQKAAADKEARDQELEALKKEVRVTKYSKRLVGIGMTESEADEMAEAIPDMEKPEEFFDKLGKFIEGIKKAAGEDAVQKLLKDRPGINAGNGDGSTNTVAEEKAKAIAKRRLGMNASDNKATDYYKIG